MCHLSVSGQITDSSDLGTDGNVNTSTADVLGDRKPHEIVVTDDRSAGLHELQNNRQLEGSNENLLFMAE